MTLARTTSINLLGLKGEPIEIEVDVSNGLPAYSLLGLPDATLSESRDRIRAAILNSGRSWPNRKVTVSLSPAWLPKSGSSFDLPIALSILTASGQLKESDLSKAFFLGELSLEGNLRPVRGVLPTLIAARDRGVKKVIVPIENFQEAGLLKDLEVLAFSKLSHVITFLESGVRAENPTLIDAPKEVTKYDMSEVAGHVENKVALEIAAAGGHNLLMIGAPGSGKTMLAERFSTILPPLDEDEAIEVSGIHSIAGTLKDRNVLSAEPPFIAPHHSTTIPALVGGGSNLIKPGACSLAHRGVLFIDEAPECDSGILDALRQPMESGSITISRSALTTSFPARFILLLAANP
ncbi:MAG: ATP-binding protein, partial [Actinobacteria bacterium]|nr:ATP-binding protein [Actinomycetota bacterium]